MALPETKRIMDRIRGTGTEGQTLAKALSHGYAVIGRGVDGAGCIAYLADLAEQGVIHLENDSWVYRDAQGRRVVAGMLGDPVIRGIARIGELTHAKKGFCEIDSHELTERIAQSAGRARRELQWRTRRSGVRVPRELAEE